MTSEFISCKVCKSKLNRKMLAIPKIGIPKNVCPVCHAELRPKSTLERIDRAKMAAEKETLPGGWTWHCWNDGSGHLESPAGNSLFSYDTNPYANCGEIEYRKDRNSGWTTFEGGLTSFRQFAEEVILKQMQR